MNWRRGFFRLWLVLSIAWAIGVGVFGWIVAADDYKPISSSETIIFYPHNESVDGTHAWGGSDCLTSHARRQEFQIEGMADRGLPMTTLVVCEVEAAGESWIDEHQRTKRMGEVLRAVERAVAKHDLDERNEALEVGAYALGAIFLLPIIALAAGSAVAWALIGFTPRT